jgi:hypothetical protein
MRPLLKKIAAAILVLGIGAFAYWRLSRTAPVGTRTVEKDGKRPLASSEPVKERDHKDRAGPILAEGETVPPEEHPDRPPDEAVPPRARPAPESPPAREVKGPAAPVAPAPEGEKPAPRKPAPPVLAEKRPHPEEHIGPEAEEIAPDPQPLIAKFYDRRRTPVEKIGILQKLGAIDRPRTYEFLGSLLAASRRATGARLRQEAIRSLGRLGTRRAVAILLRSALDEPGRVALALETLRDGDVIRWLGRDRLPKEKRPLARSLITRTLGILRHRESAPALREAFRRSTPGHMDERLSIVEALGRIGDKSARAFLVSLLREKNPHLRAASARALSEIGDPEAVPALTARLADESESLLVREAAADALGRMPDRRALAPLVASLKTREPRLFGSVVLSLRCLSGETYFRRDDWEQWWEKARKSPTGGFQPVPMETIVLPEPPPANFLGLAVCSKGALFLLDVSDSMRHEGKFDAAREALLDAIDALPAAATFNVAVFADFVRFLSPTRLLKATPKAKRRARTFLRNQKPLSAKTDIYAAFRKAFLFDGADSFFFVSDGAPTTGKLRDPRLILYEINRENLYKKVKIHSIAFFSGRKQFTVHRGPFSENPVLEFMRKLAEENGGIFLHNHRSHDR